MLQYHYRRPKEMSQGPTGPCAEAPAPLSPGLALAAAELRDELTNPEGSSQRKVPDAERTKRLQLLKSSLNGIVLEGPLDPSHVLLDKAAGLERDNQLRFLAPETCTSRSWEITHGKPERPVLAFESNKLMVKPHSEVPECHPGSALQLQEALLRRGVALAFAQLVTFPAYQKYVSALFVHFSREPPAGYARCTVSQLARADRLLFERLVEQDLKPRQGPNGKSALLNGLRDYEVCMALLPLPNSDQPRRPGKRERDANARRRESPRDDQAAKAQKGAKGSGKSKGYGKHRGKNHGLCHYCHKPGHFEAQCRKKKWDLEHAKPAAGEKLTESPPGFAKAVASCFASAVEVVESQDVDIAQLRARVGVQPESSSMPPLVPEHKHVIVMQGPASCFSALPVAPMQRLQHPWTPDEAVSPACAIPGGAQLLRRGLVADKLGDVDNSGVAEVAWGVPCKPEEFVDEALKTGHPRTLSALLPEILSEAVAKNAVTPIAEMAAERASWFGHWTSRAAELKAREAALHASMPVHRQRVLAGKKLLLWQELLEAYEYPDKGVVSLMTQGSDLEGQVPISGLFEPLFKPALMSPTQLRENAAAARAEVLASVSTPSEHDDLIAEKTELEFSKGWVSAALEPSALPQQSIVNKRFAIIQNGKPRVIDDCTASSLNCSVQKTESPKPQSTDMLASLCLSVLQAMPGTKLKGKCVDLKAAYRQVPVSEKSLDFSYVAFHNRKQARPEVRQMFALPFGASRAVCSYLRIAYSLWFLLVSALSVMVTHFFDDFVSLSREGEEDMMDKVVLGFFGLLGWTVSVDKDAPFSESFGEVSSWGSAILQHQAYRGGQRVPFPSAACRKKDIQRIRGRMLFAGGQLFGRLGRTCVKGLKDLESSDTGEVSKACAELLKSGPPRVVNAISEPSLGLPVCLAPVTWRTPRPESFCAPCP